MKIELDIKKNARQNAASFYDESKKLKAKAEGALVAIEETKRKLASESKKAAAVVAKPLAKMKESVKREWFEAFHSFKTSGGFLVIAGRDAKQNDALYAKHLTPADLFFHANIQGAPATILKVEGAGTTPTRHPATAAHEITFHPPAPNLPAFTKAATHSAPVTPREPSEQDKREAAEFAGAYSSAWKKGQHSVDVYCVTGGNVDKHSVGEFVGKGAFMIRGKREWFRNVEVKIALGLGVKGGEVGGSGRLVALPLAFFGGADAAKRKGFVVLEPGSTPKQKISQEINNRFGLINSDEAVRLLPGDSAFS